MSVLDEPAVPHGMVSLREAADYFGVKDVRSVRRELARRGLPILRFGRQIRVRAEDLRSLERGCLAYEIGRQPADTFVVPAGRSSPDGRSMPTNANRQRRRETLEPHLYREHRVRCDAAGFLDACDCPTQWREHVQPGLYREHLASCKQWKTARVRGTPSTCRCSFSCDLEGGPDPSHPTKRIYVTTHAAAKAEFRTRQVAHARVKRHVKVNGLPPEPVSAVFERFVATLPSPTTRKTYRGSFHKHHQALAELNVDELKYATAFLQAHAKTMVPACQASQIQHGIYNPQYFERNWRPIAGLLELAAEERDWPPEAVPDPRMPRVSKLHPVTGLPLARSRTQVDVLSVEQVREACEWLRTCAAIADGWGRPITRQDADAVGLTFLHGLRHGETRGLQVRCADLVHNQFHLFEQLDEYGNRRSCKYADPGETFSWDLSEPARDILARLLDDHPRRDDPYALLLYYGGDPERPYPRGYLLDVFVQAQKACGITRADGSKPATFHGLRHSGITYVAELGAQLPELMEFARHKDARTTARYLHGLNRVRRGAHRITKF